MIAIETHELTRSFGDRLAVDRLTLQIPSGSILGFLGPNGAGKTTTVRMLAALVAPTSGTAIVAGNRLGEENDRLRASIGILTESPGIYGSLTARQNLRFFGRLNGLEGRVLDERIDRLLAMLGLSGRDAERAGDFSKGMRQKLAIARAVLHEPTIIFLDEPTSALDPESAHAVRGFIRALRDDGRTVMLATHNLAEADELCDRIALFRTRLLRVDTPANLRAAVARRGVRIRLAAPAEPFAESLRGLTGVLSVEIEGDALAVSVTETVRDTPGVVRALVEAGAPVLAVESGEPSLEEVYLKLMADEPGSDASSAVVSIAGASPTDARDGGTQITGEAR